VAAENDGKYE
jgi:vacuolar protein-sorting-associated protein 4